jgi:hypothetical protein
MLKTDPDPGTVDIVPLRDGAVTGAQGERRGDHAADRPGRVTSTEPIDLRIST